MTVDWDRVAELAADILERGPLDGGQRDSLAWIVERLRQSKGAVLADEVGIGKTRIACAVIHAVIAAGGRVATVVPKGLIHQWVAESREIDPRLGSKTLTTLPELFRNADANTAPRAQLPPDPSKPEWCALSHNFRAPLLRSTSHVWRAALPALVELELASNNDRGDARTREGRLFQWLQRKDSNTVKRWAYWRGMWRIAKDVAHRVKLLPALRSAIRQLPDIKISGKHPSLSIDAFRNAGGDRITEQLLGLWLGDFDLIVIDEAHKSRGETEEDAAQTLAGTGKVLVRLLRDILNQTPTSRRLCLTATPMELDLDQWRDLLGRAGLDIGDEGKQVIDRLQQTTREAAIAPDEGARLEALCKASIAFTKLLRPHVTRRRRSEDALVQAIQKVHTGDEEPHRGGPHPHRDLRPLRVSWTDPSVCANAWIDVLFAAECMSHAARGLTGDAIGHSVKSAYTKLCNGHVSADFIMENDDDGDESLDTAADEADERTRGKIARVRYWLEQIREARHRIGHGKKSSEDLIDSEHPRITLAVREIESWTEGKAANASPGGEKVLVFGVFLRPLRVLRDVLNVRHALRAADAGRPIAHAIGKDLIEIAFRQLHRMREDGAIRGRLANSDLSGLKAVLGNAHDEYESLQKRARRAVRRKTDAWFADPERLNGISDPAISDSVRSHAMAFVLDDFLSTVTPGSERINDRVDELAEEYYRAHIHGELENVDDDTDDDAREGALRALFEKDSSTLQRRFAVLLEGSTQAATRRYIQAAFNRPRSSPRVLIAQSQVGREGLNLHEACRVVLQFHAEWNPAILEQQIGRVDRKNSLWERLARDWLKSDTTKPLPRIEVRQLMFDGTYDAFQWERVVRRQRMFDASLFGSLLPAEAWERVPPSYVPKLQAAAPNFRPPPRGRPAEPTATRARTSTADASVRARPKETAGELADG
ncbi:MAG TPA: DEAD/DEAH box helicase [Kofleriaceae bacterium]|nr:DEAD/DEAH box helicase [Kofleriaceae bacterium]